MNDFTKQELIWLKKITIDVGEDNYLVRKSESWKNLIKKIQSMTDNYCEHDWRKGVHLFNDIYCTKCNKHFEVNNEE
jgi:phenylalanine-4-hydroxylase